MATQIDNLVRRSSRARFDDVADVLLESLPLGQLLVAAPVRFVPSVNEAEVMLCLSCRYYRLSETRSCIGTHIVECLRLRIGLILHEEAFNCFKSECRFRYATHIACSVFRALEEIPETDSTQNGSRSVRIWSTLPLKQRAIVVLTP